LLGGAAPLGGLLARPGQRPGSSAERAGRWLCLICFASVASA
jgi:hypothetical protein